METEKSMRKSVSTLVLGTTIAVVFPVMISIAALSAYGFDIAFRKPFSGIFYLVAVVLSVVFSGLVCRALFARWMLNLWTELFPGPLRKVCYSFAFFIFPVIDILSIIPMLIMARKKKLSRKIIQMTCSAYLIYTGGIVLEAADKFDSIKAVINNECYFSYILAPGGGVMPLSVFMFSDAAVLCMIAFLAIFFVCLAPAFSGISYTKIQKRILVAAAASVVAGLVFPYFIFGYIDRKAETLLSELSSLDVPVTMNDMKNKYFHGGMRPDPEWTEIVDNYYRDNNEKNVTKTGYKELLSKVYSADNKKLESTLEEYRGILAKYPDEVKRLDGVFSHAPVKYAVNFNHDYVSNMYLYQLTTIRDVARMYSSRMAVAMKDGNKSEMLRLSGLFKNVIISVFDENFIIGNLVAVGSCRIWIDTMEDILDSPLLSERDILEIQKSAQALEDIENLSVIAGLRDEGMWIGDVMTGITNYYRTGNMGNKNRNISKSPIRGFSKGCIYAFWMNEAIALLTAWRDMAKVDFDIRKTYPVWSAVICRDPKDKELMKKNELAFIGIDDSFKTDEYFQNRILLSSYMASVDGVWRKNYSSINTLRMLGIACEIRLFEMKNGHLPDSLDELKMSNMPLDKFTARPFIYEHGKLKKYSYGNEIGVFSGFTLRSPGFDLIDGGGKNILNDDVVSVEKQGSFIPSNKSSGNAFSRIFELEDHK